jgi:excisionase family DNA binding protein
MSILMTVEELAKYLKIKPDTIYKKVRKGELPAIKLGKLVRFPKELIDEWIVEQAQKTMKEVRAAKKIVEEKVGEAVEKVELAVEHVVGQAKEQAEHAVEEVKKTQVSLTKSLKDLWKDINSGLENIKTSSQTKKTSVASSGKSKKLKAKSSKVKKLKSTSKKKVSSKSNAATL